MRFSEFYFLAEPREWPTRDFIPYQGPDKQILLLLKHKKC